MITPLLLAALQAIPGPAPVVHAPLDPRAVIDVASVGRVILAESPSPGLSAIRVFVPLTEQYGESGAGRVLTRLATERVRGIAARTGAKFAAVRTGRGVAYTVSGSDLDLDYLFVVVSRAAAIPSDGGVVLRRAVQEVRSRLEPAAETGRGWVVADLADRICPTVPPWTGTSQDLARFDGAFLQAFWAKTHTPAHLVVTVATALPQATVLAGLDLIGVQLSPTVSGALVDGATPSQSPASRPPSVIRRWYGEARPIPVGFEASALVVGELLSTHLSQGSGYELFAELRETACGPAIFTVGSSFRAGTRPMRQRVQGFVEELAADLDPGSVADAASTLRLRLMSNADTPEGRAEVVGSIFEGGPDVPTLIDDLAEFRLDDVVALFAAFRATDPLRAEVNP